MQGCRSLCARAAAARALRVLNCALNKHPMQCRLLDRLDQGEVIAFMFEANMATCRIDSMGLVGVVKLVGLIGRVGVTRAHGAHGAFSAYHACRESLH
eukprot:7252641-Pyramimonas_sp.AAC.1